MNELGGKEEGAEIQGDNVDNTGRSLTAEVSKKRNSRRRKSDPELCAGFE